MNPLRRAAAGLYGRRSAYAGAQMTRLTEDWIVGLLSADSAIKTSLRTLRARSRQLCEDNGHFAGWLDTMPQQVIGWEHDGIRVQSRGRTPGDDRLDRETNRYLEAAFQDWAAPEFASADQVSSFGDHQRIALRTMAQDGEVFFRRLRGFPNRYAYALQQIDADHLDEQFNVPLGAGPGGREIRMGVELDAWGAPVNYHFYKRHPDEGRREYSVLPASDVVHLFVRLRAGQTRGIPWTTPILLIHRMLDGYTEAEIMQARMAATAGGFFEMTGEDAALFGQKYDDQASLSGETSPRVELTLEPGLARQLPPGLKWAPWSPTHPNQNFGAFQKAILKVIARGVNSAYATFTGDGSENNYSSMRGLSLIERDTFRALQRFTWWRFVRPEYKVWLGQAWLAGALGGLLGLPGEYETQCRPQYRGWPWVDPLDDIQAREHEIALGVNSRQRVCAELGRDYEEVLEELAEEEALAAEVGVSVAGPQPAAPPLVRRPVPGAAPEPSPGTAGSGNRVRYLLDAATHGRTNGKEPE